MTESKDSISRESDDYDSMLDELYDLHKQLLQQDDQPLDLFHNQDAESDSDPDTDNLEIPILTESLNQEIDQEHQSRRVFDEDQHHLFEQSESAPTINQDQVNAIVNKLMGRLKPRVEQLLREKIRAKVIERFNQQN